jgi:N4-gp56 family major capsid protein
MYEQFWADYRPANARGALMAGVPGYVLAPHAFTGGNQGGGTTQTGPGTQPIIPSNEGTLGAGIPGVAFTDAARAATYGLNADFAKVVTALVVRNTIENLRDEAVFAQEGNAYLKATHVPGTNQFVYTGFSDLGPAVELLEGIPPETEKMLFDTFAFGGKQVGKTTALTDLAEIFSPFDLYAKASEKLAWNAIDYIETVLAALVNTSPVIAITATGYAAGLIEFYTKLVRRDVPKYPDGTYHAWVTPETGAKIKAETGELGWTDTMKYANPQNLLNGEIGTFRGFRFMETNRLNNGSIDEVVACGPEAYVAGDFQTMEAYRVGRGGDHADPLAQRAIMGWKGMFGFTLVAFDGTPAMGPSTNATGTKMFTAALVPTP